MKVWGKALYVELTLKRLERANLTPTLKNVSSKNVSSKERVKPCDFVTFNIIISHIFPEYFIKIRQVVEKI